MVTCSFRRLLPLLLTITLFSVTKVQAGKGVPVIQVLDGSLNQLQTDSTMMVMDSAFFNPAYNAILVKPYRVLNYVTLKINESSPFYIQSDFTASVRLRITKTLANLSTTVVDTTLTVNYRTDSIYTNKNTYHFSDAYKVEVLVLSATTDAGWNVWNLLMVENQLAPFPVFTFSCSENTIQSVAVESLDYGTGADEILVSWGNVTEADKYDLEWTYIDSVAVVSGSYHSGGNPDPLKIFDHSSSRVTITGTQYRIPLFYDGSGSLFFRVRPVQEPVHGIRIEADWSSGYSGGLGRFDFAGHQRNLNWQSTISYAEDGKRKVVVQYFDGSLRSRQTVTKDNTTNTTVVAESIYDYQGRPVIQVLPAPTMNNIVSYSQNFNIGLNGNAYDFTHFDEIIDSSYYCSASAEAMKVDSGAARYYSPENPLSDSGFHQFIPDANGYPFTETVYTPDNTGRISAQSGVGSHHRLTSGHETKYFYGTVDQKELDALFGTDAGDYSHYFKTMVRDANGQYSVSYTDMHGRTIATALAGVLPDSIKLDSLKHRITSIVSETLADSSNLVVKDLVMENSKSLVVSLAGNHTFTYELNPQSLSKEGCNDETFCYDCLYDLQIVITDDCHNQKLGGVAFDTVLHNFSVIDTTCVNPASGFSFSFTKYLEEGNYEVVKKLSVSRRALEYYRDTLYRQRNTCTTETEMINSRKLLEQNAIQCKPSCESCVDSLGTWDTFRAKYMLIAGITTEDSASYRGQALEAYTAAEYDCRLMCDSVTEADQIYNAMLMDMTAPSGQYANPDSADDPYSIFYIPYSGDNAQQTVYASVSNYVDEQGNADYVFDEEAQSLVAPQELGPKAFSEKFKLSWAKSLLPYHPEYCKLQKYLQLQAANTWLRRFEKTKTYADALAKGYLNPVDVSGTEFDRFDGTIGQIDRDPAPGLLGGSALSIFQNAMTFYTAAGTNSATAASNSGNIWALASVMTKCFQSDNSCYTGKMVTDSAFANMCTADLDMAWLNFRQMYIDTRQHIIDSIFTHGVCSTSKTAGELLAASHVPNFGEAKQAAQDFGITIPTSDSQLPGLQQQAKNQAAGYATNNCLAYTSYWFEQLSAGCTYYPADSINQVIIPQLLAVCNKGTDLSHPYGSSSIAPDSTHTYRSFQEVIEAYNASHSISDIYCNAYAITAPKPYTSQPAIGDRLVNGKPDSCACNRVTEIYNKYQGVQAGYSNFSEYLQEVYHTNMSQALLDSLRQRCATLGSVTACTFSTVEIKLPPLFQCYTGDVCITCEQFKSYDNSFKSLYPGIVPVADSVAVDTTQLTKNRFYEQYMNHQLGFVKPLSEYLAFAASCSTRLAQDSINNITDTCNRFTYIKKLGGPGVDRLVDIRQTIDGGYIMAGSTSSFGKGGTDAYVVKTDRKGNIQWSKTYGGTGDDNFAKIKLTSDSGYVAIGTTKSFHQSQGEIFVVKLEPSGAVDWAGGYAQGTTYGELGYDIIQTIGGGYALTGLHDYVSGTIDLEVLRLDSAGGVIWGKRFGTNNSDNLGGLTEDGDTLIVGGFIYSSAAQKVGGGSPTYTFYDALLVKFGKDTGNIIWAKSYDINSKSNWAFNIAATSSGYRLDVTNSDNFVGNNPVPVTLDLTKAGTVIRSRSLPAIPGMTGMSGTFPTFDGGYIASVVVPWEDALSDPYLYKVDNSGNINWINWIAMDSIQYFNQMLQSSDSSFLGVGVNESDVLFLKSNRWGRTYCNDAIFPSPASALSSTVYNLDMTPSALSFGTTAISVAGVNAATIQTNVCSLEPCAVSGVGPVLCGRSEPLFPQVSLDSVDNCMDSTFFAVSSGRELFKIYKDSLNNSFDSSYRALCMQAYRYESFTVTHSKSEYHYTLYYYDQAGSLVRTVPPAGVDVSKFDWYDDWSDSVATARANKTELKPDHFLKTDYRYNTLNQVVAQQTPDAGISEFWYDRLGRLAVSQNAKQKAVSGTEAGRQYSYTLYDGIGRISEVGQITNATGDVMIGSISRSPADLSSWLTASVAGKEQITTTVYDLAYAGFTGITPEPIVQRNLRNRVSYVSITHGANAAQYNQASFYTYDALGNVDTLLQDYGASDVVATQNVMNVNSNRFKRIVYQFDLVSGKVNSVAYQPNQADQFYHRYTYDAENRIILTETSNDSIHWEKDARYQYYKHGPLARAVLGEQQVQGLDYAYTIQGWLKGVNSSSLEIGYDMGRDGDTTWINRYVARDAFGFNLGYYTGDYAPISSTVTPFPGYSAYLGAAYKPLFNGNISSMVVNIGQFSNPMLYAYTYDQLNRLTAMDAHTGFNQSTNSWSALTATNDYKERVEYDPNGNITKYDRNGVSSVNLAMDNLTYNYNKDGNGKLLNNRLNYMQDAVSSGNYTTDIDDQSADNYSYDAIGNLIQDNAEGIIDIKWNVYGKIQEIERNATDSNPTVNIKYRYDAAGNRISKQVTNNSGNVTYTWYVRDAQGNVMGTYKSTGTGGTLSSYAVDLNEQHLYGSSRVGIVNRSVNMKTAYAQEDIVSFYRGYKQYELSNHLGNVLVTVTDQKHGVSTNGTTIDNYTADMSSANDYYPFGMGMVSRNFSSSKYRYGFNGQEKSIEIENNCYTAEFWEYDARVGKRWNIDPRPIIGLSPFNAFNNNPVINVDRYGDTTKIFSAKDGSYLRTIDDQLPNEIHFVNSGFMPANFKKYNTNDKVAEYVRNNSVAFIGKNTVDRAQKIEADANSDEINHEIFVLGKITSTRELQLSTISFPQKAYIGDSQIDVGYYFDDAVTIDEQVSSFLIGHTHQLRITQGNLAPPHIPTKPGRSLYSDNDNGSGDYGPLLNRLVTKYDGTTRGKEVYQTHERSQTPAIIITHLGITVYGTGTKYYPATPIGGYRFGFVDNIVKPKEQSFTLYNFLKR